MYDQFVMWLQYVCSKKNIPIECFGTLGKRKRYPLYAVTLNPRAKKGKTVCFTAGIHGDEIASPWACTRFIDEYDARRYSNVRIVLFPILNPKGFAQGMRRNEENIDLNRHFFDDPLRRQNELILSRLRKENIYFFCSLHEDPRTKHFYCYNYEHEEQPIYRRLVKVAANYFPINTARRICGDVAVEGLVTNVKDQTLEYRLWCGGVPHVVTPETPGKEALSKRVDCTVTLMQIVVEYCRRQ